MIKRATSLLALAVGLTLGVEANAGLPVSQELVCPVGGGKFSHTTTASYSTFGQRPDGKPYGSWDFPMDLPVCPEIGLVMYRDFSPAEVARLGPLVASPDYRRLAQERSYYRAAWLMQALGDKPDDIAWVVNQASWQADDDVATKARYQRDFVARTRVLAPAQAGSELEWFSLQARAANALRELGEFDAATAYLKALPVTALATSRPAATAACDDDCRRDLAETRTHWRAYMSKLTTVIARRDASSEPIDMIAEPAAVHRCWSLSEAKAREPLCETPKLRKGVERLRQIKRREAEPDGAN